MFERLTLGVISYIILITIIILYYTYTYIHILIYIILPSPVQYSSIPNILFLHPNNPHVLPFLSFSFPFPSSSVLISYTFSPPNIHSSSFPNHLSSVPSPIFLPNPISHHLLFLLLSLPFISHLSKVKEYTSGLYSSVLFLPDLCSLLLSSSS